MFEEWIQRYPQLKVCLSEMERAGHILKNCFVSGGKLLICGNGGSCADSGHIVGELMKGFRNSRPIPEQDAARLAEIDPVNGATMAAQLQGSLPAISLPDQTSLLTAFSNDVAPQMGYAQLVYGYGCSGDVLLCISTSGNSVNAVNAAKVAALRGMSVIALVGQKSCALDEVAQTVIHVPEQDTAHVQELHLPVYHALCEWCEAQIFGR